jgi:hypothetical protein
MERAKARKFHVIELSWRSHHSIQFTESEKTELVTDGTVWTPRGSGENYGYYWS